MSPFKFRLFLLTKIPLCFVAGIKLKELTKDKAVMSIKHSWWNQNPFKSIYFGALSMAAELSTGLLLVNAINQRKANVSMLVTGMNADFTKKAVGKILFTCEATKEINKALDSTLSTGKGESVKLTSIGIDQSGDPVAKFVFEWSVKKRKQSKA